MSLSFGRYVRIYYTPVNAIVLDRSSRRLTLQRALVAPKLPRKVRILPARLRVLRRNGALRARIGAGLVEHRACVRLGRLGHVGVRERGSVPAQHAVVVLLQRRGAVRRLEERGEGPFGG
jgi:hypothetical protein